MTIREALAEGSAALQSAGIETPGLDASLLLAMVLNTGRASLVASGPDLLSAESLAAFRALAARRLDGECVAYITGKKEFRGLEFRVNPAVLVPRPDTEILVEAALGSGWRVAANGEEARALDLCAGSGAVAVALKHEMPRLEMWAADISAEALETARANAARLLPPEPQRGKGAPIRFLRGDLYEALRFKPPPPYSLILSNPPYVPSDEIAALSREVQKEPRLALDGGVDGLDLIRKIIAGAPDFLCPGGALLLEADPRQMTGIAGLLEKRGFNNIQTYKDLSGRERVIGGVYGTRICGV